jgi:hypothetical protein
MSYLKARVFALLLILVSVGLVYYNWQQLLRENSYSMKLATFGPVVGVGGLYLLIFPSRAAGKPTTTGDKVLVLLVLGIGMAVGLVNWYLMDPGFFKR